MYRCIAAGRWLWRRPLVWLSLLTWAVLTPLAHWLLPITPAHHFDLGKAERVLDARDPCFKDSDLWTVAISSDGHTVVKLQGAQPTKVHIWDVQRGELDSELTPAQVGLGTFSYTARLSDNDEWLAIPTADAKGWIDVRFYHMPTRTMGPVIHSSEFIFSSLGRHVAYVDGTARTTRLLDLQSHTTRLLLDAKTGPDGAAVPALELGCFSPDDRFLAGTSGEFVVVVEVDTGAIVAKFRYMEGAHGGSLQKLAFAPDGQALAWGYGAEIVVMDLKENRRIVVPRLGAGPRGEKLVGWQSSEQVLIARDLHTDQPGLELWDWRNHERTAAWHTPTEIMRPGVGDPMLPPPVWIMQTRDRQFVLFACAPKPRTPSPLMAKWRGWLRLPEPPTHSIEINLLAGDTLSPLASWRIPCNQSRWVYGQPEVFQFTADGRHLVHVGTNTVELWPIPPQSWLRSMLWSGGGTLAMILLVAIWRFWRTRRLASVAPTAPPPPATTRGIL